MKPGKFNSAQKHLAVPIRFLKRSLNSFTVLLAVRYQATKHDYRIYARHEDESRQSGRK